MSHSPGLKLSYEFFPPRSAKMERRLWRAMGQLERLRPEFFSMTYGALGSAQQVSVDSALAMHRESPVEVAAHLTCANADRGQVMNVAQDFSAAGIRRIVALRGDAVDDSTGGSQYAYGSAVELVEALTQLGSFDISVAAYPEGHPQARSDLDDLRHLQRKFDAGAQRAITQYFFDAESYLRFRDRTDSIGIDKPIVPGILPIHDLEKVVEFSQRCGASVPREYAGLYDKVTHDSVAQYELSLQLAVDLCGRLIREGVDHIHLYTLNQTDMCLDISLALGASLNPLQVSSAA
ncbi:MAG: 5,10-methylenetetrahydrofolate reductase [Gammaproteobacteria bacterium]|nr:5,10-methylenetetrahydrofolate reductase [Gammaproteobacteria bacterium]